MSCASCCAIICGKSGSYDVHEPNDVPLVAFNDDDTMVDSGSMALTYKVR